MPLIYGISNSKAFKNVDGTWHIEAVLTGGP